MNSLNKSKNLISQQLKIFLFIYIFTIFSGATRKWFISSKELGNLILFFQILVPFLFLFTKNFTRAIHQQGKVMGFYLSVLIICAINPLNLTFYHGILGFFLYASFPILLFYYINSRAQFNFIHILQLVFFICLGELVLAFLQSSLPPDSFINTYADVEAVGSIATVGNAARVTGTFSYISGFTAFLFFLILFVWALVIYQFNSTYVLIILIIGLIGCFMSGARAATYLYLIILGTLALTDFSNLRSVLLNIRIFVPILFISIILLSIGSDRFFDLINNSFTGFLERRARGIESGEENSRIFSDIVDVIQFRGNYPTLGVGLGSTYQGATKLFGTSPYVVEYGFYESELVRIVLEGGFVLLIARTIIIISLINALYVPKIGKIVLIIIFLFFFPTIFNVYNASLGVMGLMILDSAYFHRRNMQLKFGFERQRTN